MQRAGLIGGIGPESTIDYYRTIIERYRERSGDGSYPSFLVDSIDLTRMVELVTGNRLAEVAEYLLVELERLARAGADFAALTANTPHIVFDDLRARSPLPLISIVEAAREAVVARGLVRVGLLGTRFTMQARFYPDVMARGGVAVVVPRPPDLDYVHDKYMTELLKGTFLPATRDGLLEVVASMRAQDGIEGVILGGTELPLLLREDHGAGVPFFDTTRLHVDAIVARMLEK